MWDKLLMAYRSIRERKARSILTVLGIAVGIAAIVSLMSVGYGMEEAITGELSGMADIIQVMPGKITGMSYVVTGGFTDRDVKDLQRISGIKDVSAMTYDSVEVEYRNEKKTTFVLGGDTKDLESIYAEPVGLKEGRWLRENDYKGCVIGDYVANDFFDEVIHVNDKLFLNGDKFVVIGVFEKGDMMHADVDRNIFLTLRAAKEVLQTDDIKYVMVRVYDIDEAEEIAEEIEKVINDNHGLDDFATAMTMGSMLDQIGDIFNIIRGVLVGIAAIALIVASIGIMNTMLMSVMERTHEIGVMKAIGAKSSDVLTLFLFESSIVSLVGGVAGCLLGWGVAIALSSVASMMLPGMELAASVKPGVLLGGIAVAMIVGTLSGFYPARKASRMSPVEAVRYS
ncbi:MAG: hypothetical protein C5S38_09385 [Candidatus Methanophagaceae archaeon]|nr:MAG: hypothetical protein C5S38_09385 [Methanophagales archaeon]KAF5434931.1 putative ABC transport system permease protein [Methanophagales archaeon]